METELIQCSGFRREVDKQTLDYFRTHYANKSEAYCRSNRGHVQKKLYVRGAFGGYVYDANNHAIPHEARLCELHAINERLADLQNQAWADAGLKWSERTLFCGVSE